MQDRLRVDTYRRMREREREAFSPGQLSRLPRYRSRGQEELQDIPLPPPPPPPPTHRHVQNLLQLFLFLLHHHHHQQLLFIPFFFLTLQLRHPLQHPSRSPPQYIYTIFHSSSFSLHHVSTLQGAIRHSLSLAYN